MRSPPVVCEICFGSSQDNQSYIWQAATMITFANGRLYRDMISVPDYVIRSGDYLEYEVWWEQAGNIMCAFDYNTDLPPPNQQFKDSGAVDQHGRSVHPDTDLSSVAFGQWYYRKIALPAGHVGRTITHYLLACEQDTAGTYTARYRNIKITNGAGLTRFRVWAPTDDAPTYGVYISFGVSSVTNGLVRNIAPVSMVWTDVTDRLLSYEIKWWRDNELERVGPSTFEGIFENYDRALEPEFAASPYYPNVDLGKEIRVRVPRYYETTKRLSGLVGLWLLDDSAVASTAVAEVGTNGTYTSPSSRSTPLIAGDQPSYEASSPIDGAGGWGWCRNFGSDALDIDLGDIHDFTGTAAFSLEAWIDPSTIDATVRRIMGKHTGSDGYYLAVVSTNTLRFVRQTAAGADTLNSSSGAVTTAGGIYHVVATYDGTSMRLYVNGALVAGPLASSRSLVNTSNDFRIAGDAVGGNRFVGRIDEPAVYNRALTEKEIADQHWRGRTGWHAHRFRGVIDDIQNDWDGRNGEARIAAADHFSVLETKKISGYRAVELPEARLPWVLDQAAFPSWRRSIDSGTAQIEASWSVTGTLLDNDSALEHLLDVGEADTGTCFMLRDGFFAFRDRNERVGASVFATFSDNPGPGEFLYIDIVPAYAKEMIFNEVKVRPIAAVTDAAAYWDASSDKYQPRTLERVAWLTTLAEAQAQAEALVTSYQAPKVRFREIEIDLKRVDPAADFVTTWPNWGAVLGPMLNTKLTLERSPPGGGASLVKSAFVEGGSETVDGLKDGRINWRTRLVLSPA